MFGQPLPMRIARADVAMTPRDNDLGRVRAIAAFERATLRVANDWAMRSLHDPLSLPTTEERKDCGYLYSAPRLPTTSSADGW